MKYLSLLLTALFLISLASCGKEASRNKLLPLKVGNKWTYRQKTSSPSNPSTPTSEETVTIEVIDKKRVKDKIRYTLKSDESNAFYDVSEIYYKAPNYYILSPAGDLEIILKDAAEEGEYLDPSKPQTYRGPYKHLVKATNQSVATSAGVFDVVTTIERSFLNIIIGFTWPNNGLSEKTTTLLDYQVGVGLIRMEKIWTRTTPGSSPGAGLNSDSYKRVDLELISYTVN
jgi:hypothetical protein